MQVKINGDADEVSDDASINDVLISRSIPLEVAIIAVNGEIVKRDRWQDMKLSPGDDLEIIRIIGGG